VKGPVTAYIVQVFQFFIGFNINDDVAQCKLGCYTVLALHNWTSVLFLIQNKQTV